MAKQTKRKRPMCFRQHLVRVQTKLRNGVGRLYNSRVWKQSFSNCTNQDKSQTDSRLQRFSNSISLLALDLLFPDRSAGDLCSLQDKTGAVVSAVNF